MQKYPASKPGTPSMVPSKNIIVNWLKLLFPDVLLNTKIEDFGDGVIYCRLLNHHYSNPPHTKITWSPKNEYQYANNLKHAQLALLQLRIPITFDVNRVSKRKFLENWALINAFYRHFNSPEELISNQQSHVSNNNSFSSQPQNPQIAGQSQLSVITKTPQNYLKKSQSSSSHEVEPKNVLKQSIMNAQNYSAPNFQQPLWDQKPQAELANIARNSLQMSQYFKQNTNLYNNSPAKGKWSVGSQMFQNNNNAVVDRVKQILLKGSHDTQKIMQIKMLLGIPLDDEQVIKIEDDIATGPIVHSHVEQKVQKAQKAQSEEVVKGEPAPEPKQTDESTTTKQSMNCKQSKNSASKGPKRPFKV